MYTSLNMHGNVTNEVIHKVLDLKNQSTNADTSPTIRNNSTTQKNITMISKQKHQAYFGHLTFYAIAKNYASN